MTNREVLDLRGMKCLKVIWNLTSVVNKLKNGAIVEVISDCSSFQKM